MIPAGLLGTGAGPRLRQFSTSVDVTYAAADFAGVDEVVILANSSGVVTDLTITIPSPAAVGRSAIVTVFDTGGAAASKPIKLAMTGGGTFAGGGALPLSIITDNYRWIEFVMPGSGTTIYGG